MDRKKIVIIDDNGKFSTVLHYLFSVEKTYKVVAVLTHEEAFKNQILPEASIAIVAVKSTDQKTLETVRFIKETYSLKILALPLHLMDTLVYQLKSMKVDGILSKNSADPDNILEALNQISNNGKYYKLKC